MDNNIKELIQELRFQYERVNGREFIVPTIEGEIEEWRIDFMKKSIETFKKLPSCTDKIA